jgi:multidrug efflux pump subunit AcrA (membrane-fusion protein)
VTGLHRGLWPRTTRGRIGVVGAAVAVLAGGIGVGGVASAAGSSGGAATTSTARVVRTDLASTVQVGGSIGFDGSYTIVNPGGSSLQAVTQSEQKVAADQAALSADQTAASDTDASNAQSVDQSQAAVDVAQTTLSDDQANQAAACAGAGAASPACSQENQKVSQDQAQLSQQQASLAGARLNATKATHQDQARLNQDSMNLQNDQAALLALEQTASNPGATYTALPAVGQVVTQGRSLYVVNGVPVPLFIGTVPMWRDLSVGMTDGPDVSELTQNLIQLGFGAGLTQSSHFSQATAAAVMRWQASLGAAQTGVVRLGDVVFEPVAIRVTAVHPTLGGAVSPGPVLDASSTTRVVTVALEVTQEYLVHAGDAVSVVLPDGTTTTPGHVRDISTVATTPSGSGNGSSSTPTVTVTIVLDNPASSGKLDQAPVNVNITDQSVHGVLAVPINALLALAEGGDAVDVVNPDGSRRLVAVQTGLFSNTMVQISGSGITEGMLVEVPSS